MQIGYVLGRQSAFAHTDPVNFVNSFTEAQTDTATGDMLHSKLGHLGRLYFASNNSLATEIATMPVDVAAPAA